VLDREVGGFEVRFGSLAALVRPCEEDGDEAEGVRAGNVAFEIVADHHGLPVVRWIYLESIERGAEQPFIGFGKANGL